MLAKKTSKNQITLPKAIVKQLPEVEYFEVSLRKGEVVLSPVEVNVPGEKLKAVRAKIRALGLTEKVVEQAIHWARSRQT
ncbi:MAG: AbrB/MazE/SpoVT family DNA-binding domain-containing protein [candidate division NC10 bacterium]|nr:AbrB/MazE/SpoVT family DNA-binding domain-containing protein [candidate division NC10 bacterium]MDE2321047.1 AbrB/MazE/SpoVT family DNA-binding domain-containing protein [candidate division NC10 bacterium]